MIRVYTTSLGKLTQYKNISFDEIRRIGNVVWIDLQSPTPEEKEFVEKNYKIEFFTSLELQEIESSSRFLETDETIEINLGVISSDNELAVQNATFILKGNTLFTYRQGELRIFAEAVRKLKSASSEMKEHGLDVFLSILETHIDSDADLIESINRKVNTISKDLIAQRSLKRNAFT
jgi:magnesium transporter